MLAVSENNTAVYLPAPQPRVDVIDETGTTVSSTLLPKPPSSSAAVVPRRQPDDLVDRRFADGLRREQLTLRYTIAAGDRTAPLGPGVMMAGRLLVPVTGAIGVYDPLSGANERYIPVDRSTSAPPDGTGVPGRFGFPGVRAARRHRGRAGLTSNARPRR